MLWFHFTLFEIFETKDLKPIIDLIIFFLIGIIDLII